MSDQLTIGTCTLEERPTLERLLQYYLHDLSEFASVEMGTDGTFEYPYLSHYWKHPDRHPLLMRLADRVIGFALVRDDIEPAGGTPTHDLQEFFVIRKERRRGLGAGAAVLLWNRLPGKWRLEVNTDNEPAYRFWKRAVAKYTNACYDEQPTTAPLIRFSFLSV